MSFGNKALDRAYDNWKTEAPEDHFGICSDCQQFPEKCDCDQEVNKQEDKNGKEKLCKKGKRSCKKGHCNEHKS